MRLIVIAESTMSLVESALCWSNPPSPCMLNWHAFHNWPNLLEEDCTSSSLRNPPCPWWKAVFVSLPGAQRLEAILLFQSWSIDFLFEIDFLFIYRTLLRRASEFYKIHGFGNHSSSPTNHRGWTQRQRIGLKIWNLNSFSLKDIMVSNYLLTCIWPIVNPLDASTCSIAFEVIRIFSFFFTERITYWQAHSAALVFRSAFSRIWFVSIYFY